MVEESRKNVVSDFRKKTDKSFHLINGCKANEFEELVYNYINSYIEEYAPGTEIIDVVLIGSRARGIENTDSDMDFIFAYEGEMKEHEMFNLLNQKVFSLAGIKVDINPIHQTQTGTLDSYLIRAEEYLSLKEIEYEERLYKRWEDAAVSYGYPITVGNSIVVFPDEYDDVFSIDEQSRLKRIMLSKMKDGTELKRQQQDKSAKQELDAKQKSLNSPVMNTLRL